MLKTLPLILCLLAPQAQAASSALSKAEAYMAQGDWDLAAKEAQKAAFGSSAPDAWRLLGEARYGLGDLEGAASAFEKAGLDKRAAALRDALDEAGKVTPTPRATSTPKPLPSATQTPTPTRTATAAPTALPTPTFTLQPTEAPTAGPTPEPTSQPTSQPTFQPTSAAAPDSKLEEERKALEDEKAKLEEEKRKLAEERARLEEERGSAGAPAQAIRRGGISLATGIYDPDLFRSLKDHDSSSAYSGGSCCCGNCPGGGREFDMQFNAEIQARWRDFYLGFGFLEGSGEGIDFTTSQGTKVISSPNLVMGQLTLGWAWNILRPKKAPGFGLYLPMALEANVAQLDISGPPFTAMGAGAHAGLGLRFQVARWLALEAEGLFHVKIGHSEFMNEHGDTVSLGSYGGPMGGNGPGSGSNMNLDTMGPQIKGGLFFSLW